MHDGQLLLDAVSMLANELTLFAAIGFIIGGSSDLAIDCVWIARVLWRRAFVYSRYQRVCTAGLPPPTKPGRIAIFIPAWDESAVIATMLRHAVETLNDGDWIIYVGAYPNDPATIAAVRSVAHPRVQLVIGAHPGPTTKADCLNTIWERMCADEARGGRCKAIVLHDAEDVMHSAEIQIYDTMIERFALVQLPVLPLADAGSRWVGGHYIDEFAESHGKTMVVREAIGAAIPSAGVGCAFDRELLGRIAAQRGGTPFDADSLTEDYELGLRIAALGGHGAFVRLPTTANGAAVAIRAHFPAQLDAAVRQKARWIVGIALSGWDRLGWRGGLAETWMRLNDRRALLAAAVLLAAYAALFLHAVLWTVSGISDVPRPPASDTLVTLTWVCLALLIWRLAMRFAFVLRAFGLSEAILSVPRAVLGNIIAMMAARRAVSIYLRMRRDGVVRWDKTAHAFPTVAPAE